MASGAAQPRRTGSEREGLRASRGWKMSERKRGKSSGKNSDVREF